MLSNGFMQHAAICCMRIFLHPNSTPNETQALNLRDPASSGYVLLFASLRELAATSDSVGVPGLSMRIHSEALQSTKLSALRSRSLRLSHAPAGIPLETRRPLGPC